MYIEYEVHKNEDFAEIINYELFPHCTRNEAADVILKIISDFFNYYDGGNQNEDS